MKSATARNFHVPLPDPLYRELRAQAQRAKVPATTVAREAIEAWLKDRAQEALSDAIAAYATRWAGSEIDLDPEMEAASIEHVVAGTRKRKR